MRRHWHPVAAAAELAAHPVKPVKILGESLVLYRDQQGRLGLIGDTCPHRRISLAHGIPEPEGLRCPYHGWMFDQSGQCIEMPAEPVSSTFPCRVKIDGYPVAELGGLIFAYLGPEPVPLLPRWDLFVMDGIWRDIGITEIPCNWLQCMENSLDPVHTEWLHGHYYNFIMRQRNQSDARGQGFVERLLPHHVKIGFEVFEHGIIKRRVREGGSEADPSWHVGHPILFPNILRVNWTFQIRVPMDDTHTWHVMYQAYPPPPGREQERQEIVPVYDIPLKDERGRFITDFVLGQDMMAWVTQGAMARRHLERLGESDAGIILYRRLLRQQMALAEGGGELMNVFRDPAANQLLRIPVERGLEETARMRALSTGQAPYSALLDEVETAWVREAAAAD
jgi:5,5'-dehydrodivanillate O-demethylase